MLCVYIYIRANMQSLLNQWILYYLPYKQGHTEKFLRRRGLGAKIKNIRNKYPQGGEGGRGGGRPSPHNISLEIITNISIKNQRNIIQRNMYIYYMYLIHLSICVYVCVCVCACVLFIQKFINIWGATA